ncbi:TPA: hypothetical protein SAN82_001631 [Pseudomonas putida]|nr:hypothetical protein [Pseudomonas putida]
MAQQLKENAFAFAASNWLVKGDEMAKRLQEIYPVFPSDSRVAVSAAQVPSLEARKLTDSETFGTAPEN